MNHAWQTERASRTEAFLFFLVLGSFFLVGKIIKQNIPISVPEKPLRTIMPIACNSREGLFVA